MKSHWQTKKLSDLYDITSSKRVFKSEWKREGVPFYRAREIVKLAKQGYVHNDLFISEEMYKKYSEKYGAPKEGDIMVTGVGTLGVCYVVKKDDKFYFKDGNIIWLRAKGKVDSRLIEYAFQSEVFKQQINDSKGATVGTYTIIKAKNTAIALPPLPEQKRIVKILDEIFEKVRRAKENAERNLQNSKELFESYLQSVFATPGKGWEEKTLEEISLQFGRGKSKHRPRNDKRLYGGKYPFIQTGDIRNSNHRITEYSQTYNDVGLKQSKLWPKGTLCITIAANIAETGILDFGACFPDSVIGLVVNPKVADTNFVEYLLQSFKTVLKKKGKGSAQDNINMATFEHERFPFPPLTEQKAIVKKLDWLSGETKKLEGIYRRKLADLEELKKSVLRRAFRGEL